MAIANESKNSAVKRAVPKGGAKKAQSKKETVIGSGLSFLILFPMFLLMLPTTLLFFFSMLPTFGALILDAKNSIRYKWLTIGGLNFAGALPFLFQLWFDDNTVDGAIAIFMRFSSMLVIYGSALIGWLFYKTIPPLVLGFLEMNDQRRVLALREMQKKLIDKWGEEVTIAPVSRSVMKKKVSNKLGL